MVYIVWQVKIKDNNHPRALVLARVIPALRHASVLELR